MFNQDDFVSLKIWLNDVLPAKQYMVFEGDLSLYSNDTSLFALGFISPQQQELIKKSRTFCLDATYNISRRVDDILYSIVVRDELIDRGHPVAYMITNDHSLGPVTQWLNYLKTNGLVVNPEQITIDCSDTETTAIRNIFPSCDIQYCLFHVSQAWNRQLNLKVRTGVSPADNRIMRAEIMTELKSILFEEDIDAFHLKIEQFMDSYSNFETFIDYFEKEWCSEEKFKIWSRAYHPLEFSHMLTNNFIESWHNQLKSVYLMRSRNRRLDRLVYILTVEVEYDLEREKQRILENTGAMTRAQRERRRVEIAAEQITPERRNVMIAGPSGERANDVDSDDTHATGSYTIESFTTEDTVYSVSVDSNRIIQSCTCYYFRRNQKACKHMHLLKIHVSDFRLLQALDATFSDTTVQNSNGNDGIEESSLIDYELSQTNEIISTLYHNRRDLLSTKDSTTLEDAQLLKQNLKDALTSFQNYMDKYNNLRRMNTQRQ